MMRKGALVIVGLFLTAGCSAVRELKGNPSDTVSEEQLARVPPDQMGPVNQARSVVAKAQDEAARRDLAVKSADQENEVAKQELNVAKSQVDKTNAILNKANFDRNSQAGRQAQRDLTIYQSQLDAANAAAELAKGEKKQADAERDLAQARLQLAEVQALNRRADEVGIDTDNATRTMILGICSFAVIGYPFFERLGLSELINETWLEKLSSREDKQSEKLERWVSTCGNAGPPRRGTEARARPMKTALRVSLPFARAAVP